MNQPGFLEDGQRFLEELWQPACIGKKESMQLVVPVASTRVLPIDVLIQHETVKMKCLEALAEAWLLILQPLPQQWSHVHIHCVGASYIAHHLLVVVVVWYQAFAFCGSLCRGKWAYALASIPLPWKNVPNSVLAGVWIPLPGSLAVSDSACKHL